MELIPQGGGTGAGDDNATLAFRRGLLRGSTCPEPWAPSTPGAVCSRWGHSSGWMWLQLRVAWLPCLFPWGICPLVSKYAVRSLDSPDWRRSPISSLLSQFLQKQASAGELPVLLCAAGAARAGFSLGGGGGSGERESLLFVTLCDYIPILYLFIFKSKVEDLQTKLAQLRQGRPLQEHHFSASTGELLAGSLGLQTTNVFSSRKF